MTSAKYQSVVGVVCYPHYWALDINEIALCVNLSLQIISSSFIHSFTIHFYLVFGYVCVSIQLVNKQYTIREYWTKKEQQEWDLEHNGINTNLRSIK